MATLAKKRTTKKKHIAKPKLRIPFLMYPDWKSWQAMAPEMTSENYGDYCSEVVDLQANTEGSILVAVNSHAFGDFIREHKLDFDPKKLNAYRDLWVNSLPKKECIHPHVAPPPLLEKPTASFSRYGDVDKEIIYYMMVAIHYGKNVKDHHQFIVGEFVDFETMIDAIYLYIDGFGVINIMDSEEIIVPNICSDCESNCIGYRVWKNKEDIEKEMAEGTSENFDCDEGELNVE